MQVKGCGLGLRSEFIHDMDDYFAFHPDQSIEWFEVVPENWIYTPKKYQKTFDKIARDYKFVAHGLSLSIGSPEPLNMDFLKSLKIFLDRYNIKDYSEHLSFSSLENLTTHELLPLPMTPKVIQRVVERVDKVQNYLQRKLILENATYYYVPESTMSEIDFINEVLKKSGAKLLLDVNNVFVNGFNHSFDPYDFIDKIDTSSLSYYHVAGHLEYKDDLYIDTHGSKVKKDVWQLLEYSLKKSEAPVLLERDNNIPPFKTLMKEYNILKDVYYNTIQ
jgi:uncharacterized protein (UPF0276 family)